MPGHGIIASGGSLANLVALTAARDQALGGLACTAGLQAGGAPLVPYTTEEAHSSIDKAVSILGLATNHLRRLPTDEQFRLRLDILAEAVAADRSSRGQTPRRAARRPTRPCWMPARSPGWAMATEGTVSSA